LAVLNAAADKAGWGKPLPAGVFRGIAQFMGYASYSAAVAEVTAMQCRPVSPVDSPKNEAKSCSKRRVFQLYIQFSHAISRTISGISNLLTQ
jgi:hypothetical protein